LVRIATVDSVWLAATCMMTSRGCWQLHCDRASVSDHLMGSSPKQTARMGPIILGEWCVGRQARKITWHPW
jgi:hypothetical protein